MTKKDLIDKLEGLQKQLINNNERITSKWKDHHEYKIDDLDDLSKNILSAKHEVYSMVIRKLNEIIELT
jgi:hypothetical protein